MRAQRFSKHVLMHIVCPTPDKVLAAARRHRLKDTYSELHWWVGAYLDEAQREEFRQEAPPILSPKSPMQTVKDLATAAQKALKDKKATQAL